MRHGRRKSLSFRFHEILRYSQDDKVFRLRPKRKPIRSVLINRMCYFEDGTKPPTASLWSGLFDISLFKGHLYYLFAYSERTYKRYVQNLRRNTSRNGGEQISAEQNGCTSDCAVLLRSRRTKRSGITSGRYLSMRVPPVFPASDG